MTRKCSILPWVLIICGVLSICDVAISNDKTKSQNRIMAVEQRTNNVYYQKWLLDKAESEIYEWLARPVVGMTFCDNDTRLVTVRVDGSVEQWGLKKYRSYRRGPDLVAKSDDKKYLNGFTAEVGMVHSTQTGNVVICTYYDRLFMLDVRNQDARWEELRSERSLWCTTSSISEDGSVFAFSEVRDGYVSVTHIGSGVVHSVGGIHNGLTHMVSLSPDGKKCATLGFFNDEDKYRSELKVWDVGVTSSPTYLVCTTGYVNSINWVSNDKVIAGTSDGLLMMWDVHKPSMPTIVRSALVEVAHIEVSREAMVAAYKSIPDNTVEVISLTNSLLRQVFPLHSSIRSMKLSNNGRLLAVGGGDGTIRILRTDWDGKR